MSYLNLLYLLSPSRSFINVKDFQIIDLKTRLLQRLNSWCFVLLLPLIVQEHVLQKASIFLFLHQFALFQKFLMIVVRVVDSYNFAEVVD
jgi:hypothetical protein